MTELLRQGGWGCVLWEGLQVLKLLLGLWLLKYKIWEEFLPSKPFLL